MFRDYTGFLARTPSSRLHRASMLQAVRVGMRLLILLYAVSLGILCFGMRPGPVASVVRCSAIVAVVSSSSNADYPEPCEAETDEPEEAEGDDADDDAALPEAAGHRQVWAVAVQRGQRVAMQPPVQEHPIRLERPPTS